MEDLLKLIELDADEILAVSGGGSITGSGNGSTNTLNGSGNDNSIVVGNGVYIPYVPPYMPPSTLN